MKKIIRGKKYDTETARLVGEYDAPYATNDFHYYHEELYCKRTGEYFLHGEGGPMTHYAQRCPDGMCGGENIEPMSLQEAQEWAERHLDPDVTEQEFAIPDEHDEKVKTLLSLSPVAADKLQKMAVEKGVSKSQIIDELILGK